MLNRAIQTLWPLSETFEYAAEVGLALRGLAPGWWQAFERDVDPRRFPLPQAQGFAFVQYLERSADVERDELVEVIASAVRAADSRLLTELDASLDCLSRNFEPQDGPFEPTELFGEPVALYAPAACAGYPDASTLALDAWTREALEGADVVERSAEPASVRQLAGAHSHFYVQGLLAFARAGGGLLTPETFVTPDAERSVRAAAGAVVDASRRALRGERGRVPLCLVRPGSHHAEKARAGGTCLVNNLAVAAVDALRHGARSVAIVDLDAHHGNGTEDIFREDPRVLTVSVHQAGAFFPGTGHADEVGRGRGAGRNVNLPVGPGEDWLAAVETGLVHVQRHRPQLILVEFSTDAHSADPVSDLQASDEDFEQAVAMIESLNVPVVYELGASLSRRAWVGGVRALVSAAAR